MVISLIVEANETQIQRTSSQPSLAGLFRCCEIIFVRPQSIRKKPKWPSNYCYSFRIKRITFHVISISLLKTRGEENDESVEQEAESRMRLAVMIEDQDGKDLWAELFGLEVKIR